MPKKGLCNTKEIPRQAKIAAFVPHAPLWHNTGFKRLIGRGMHHISRSARLPYTAAQMYALVADIEKYPEFLPWCAGVVLHKTDAFRQEATLTVQKGFFRQSLRTINHLDLNHAITITLAEGPFKHFEGRWRFVPHGHQVEVTYSMDFQMAHPMMAAVATPLFDKIASEMVDVFHERAKALYGAGTHVSL